MITLHLAAVFENAETEEEARIALDAFREAVLPASEWGILIYEEQQDEKEAEPVTAGSSGFIPNQEEIWNESN